MIQFIIIKGTAGYDVSECFETITWGGRKVSFRGKEYNAYGATQRQHQMGRTYRSAYGAANSS